MKTIDFSIIENWLKDHGGKTFKSGELNGAPARNMYISFVQAVIEGSNFVSDYSVWQNSGHTIPYFWAKIREKSPKKRNSFLGIAMSAQIVDGELEILMRLESEDNKIKDLPLKERKAINRKLLQMIPSDRCYYSSNVGSQTYSYDDALRMIENDVKYKGVPTFKMRPNIRLMPPFSEERVEDVIADAKEIFKLFIDAYNKMFASELDDEWWPSLQEYDPGISAEMWREFLLEDAKLYPETMKMLQTMLNLGGEATCYKLAEVLGDNAQSWSSRGSAFGRRAKNKFNISPCMDGETERFFPAAFMGRKNKDLYSWKLRDELKEALEGMDLKAIESVTNIELNTILYGPPGTGKTYHTVLYAVSIIEDTDIEALKSEEYSEILERYNMYKDAGLIEFTTFHQSYGYEEFIEGIKPVVGEDGQMSYKVVPGVFKRFCDKASTPKSKKVKTNSDPVVWKVSLAKTGDNPIRTECLNNDHIRIGWNEYGETISEETEFSRGGKAILNAFINEMREGDIVISCYSESTADAIGIVSGPYSWHPEYSDYKRVRPVKWIAKGKFNITDINGGKNMTLSTVYRLNNIELDKLYAYMSAESDSVNENNDRHVFIIDEINRGNVSKILGEAITLIESTKRKGMSEELQVTLPYSGKKFGVPKNVYIIGTMNTADRSIALMDTALRRRFVFVEMMPNSELFNDVDIDGVSVKMLLEAINNRIHYLYDREHTIGHAYFMDLLKKENRNINTLRRILKNSILPLLQEYFYDDYDKIAEILGDKDRTIFFKEINAAGITFDGEIKYEIDYGKLDNLTAEDIKKIYQ